MPSTQPQRPYNVSYYWRNRQTEIDRVMRRQRATLEWLRALRRVPCMDCGKTLPPHVMDFDHRDPNAKSFSLAADKVLLKNRALLEAEVAKCDVICANCHRIRTAAQYAEGVLEFGFKPSETAARTSELQKHRERWRRRRKEQMDVLVRLRSMPCMSCGEAFPTCCMEFDHRDGVLKNGLVSRMAGRVKIATLLEEVAKCDIVCSNCHRDRSFHQRQSRAGVAQWKCTCLPSRLRGFDSRLPLSSSNGESRLVEEARSTYRFAA